MTRHKAINLTRAIAGLPHLAAALGASDPPT